MYCGQKTSTDSCTERMEGEHCHFDRLFGTSQVRTWALLDPFA
jgi:hypothetical protein